MYVGCREIECIVLYRLSTSNHNPHGTEAQRHFIVLYRLSTSNHNYYPIRSVRIEIVLYRLSTSNHNSALADTFVELLSYIVFLHQTTTSYEITLSSLVLSYIVFLHQTTT